MKGLVCRKKTTSLHPFASYGALRLSLVAVRVGRTTAQAIAAMRLSDAFSPLILGEVIASNVTLSSRAQVEALFFVVSHVSLRSPGRLAWFLERIAQLVAKCSTGSLDNTACITTWLARQSLLRQVTAVGLHGNVASALAAAAVQITMHTGFLVRRSVTGVEDSHVALQQFYYDCITSLSSGAASVVGGSCGAVVGGLLFPGVGTALGSLFGSMGGGLVPYMMRRGGPDADRAAALQICSSQRPLKVVEDESDWLIVTDCEGESQFMFFDQLSGDSMLFVEEGPSMMDGDSSRSCGNKIGDAGAGARAKDVRAVPHNNSGVGAADEFVEFVDSGGWKETMEEMPCNDESVLLFFAVSPA